MKSSFNEAMMRSLCLLSKMVINACLWAFYSRPGKTAENSSQTTSSCNLPSKTCIVASFITSHSRPNLRKETKFFRAFWYF